MWQIEVSKRFSQVDKKTRSSVTGILSTIGIALGVLTLITVMSVMNGFQRSFIDAILEISSFHVRVTDVKPEEFTDFIDACENISDVVSFTPFYEETGIITGNRPNETGAIIRGTDKDIFIKDQGFRKELKMIYGVFDLSSPDSIVLGSVLASKIGVRCGDNVNILALGNTKNGALLSENRVFKVRGIFESGYYDINENYAFISLEDAERYFGEKSGLTYGLKLKKSTRDGKTVRFLQEKFPESSVKSWREFNRSFFGTLRVEKNVLKLIVCLIFIVVGINIFNSMRRLVFERSREIAVLEAFGGREKDIRLIFLLRGAWLGFTGSVSGTVLGIIMSLNMSSVFMFISRAMFTLELFFTKIFNPSSAPFVEENPMYSVYASIPARIFPGEVVFIALFGFLAPVLASYLSTKIVTKLKVSEVLRYE